MLQQCLNWLKQNGSFGLDNLTVKESCDCKGLGCFALKNFKIGDLLFSIPLQCIFGINKSSGSLLAEYLRYFATVVDRQHIVTSELLIWVHMILEKNSESFFSNYFNSLNVRAPTPHSWSQELCDLLDGTNIGSTLKYQMDTIRKQASFLHDASKYFSTRKDEDSCEAIIKMLLNSKFSNILESYMLNESNLIWAVGHYLSRRYPGHFESTKDAEGGLLVECSLDPREPNMQNLGALVPFLDILNHNHDHEWLKFDVCCSSDGVDMLNVYCNYPIHQV